MNATDLCQTTPNIVLFGEEGCCSQGDEPVQLAKWTGKLCNGSEWRQEFDICGGMACPDWREWIMPWNWTVQSTTLAPDKPACKSPSRYLAIYAIEHLCWLVLSFGIGALRLWVARHEEHKNRSIFRFLLVSTWAHLRSPLNSNEIIKKKLSHESEHLRPSFTDPLKWGFPVIMGVFLAGLQLGFNFWVAHIIKSVPGYEDVPLVKLALLFCCRPRLSWLSCLLALTPNGWLVSIFHFKHDGDGLWAAKLVLSSVAVSSAVTESIMQLLGSVSMGTVAHIGAQRDFYPVHHLRPKMWGNDARRMYLGALFWVMLCIPLVAIWFLVALFFSQVYHAVAGWRRGIFHYLKKKEDKVPKLAEGPVEWLLDHINPDPKITHTATSYLTERHDLPTEYYAPDLPYRATLDDPFADQPTRYNGPATGSLFADQPLRAQQSSQHSEFNDQPMRATHAVSGAYRQSPLTLQRRTPSGGQYNSLPQADVDPALAEHVPSPVLSQRRTASGGRYNPLAQADDMDTINIVEDQPLVASGNLALRHEAVQPSHHDSSNATLLASSAPLSTGAKPSLSSGKSSLKRRSDYTEKVNLKWQGWEKKIIWAGAFLGMLAYAAQWVFWDGFVKAAGDRFCPTSIGKVNGVWGAGTVLCKCAV
jgi:hypothetical protein